MSALRLLLVTDAVGGVWVYSLELARALRPLGVETVLAVMGPSPGPQQRAAAEGFRLIDTGLPLEWLDTNSNAVARAAEELAGIASREGADVVQTSSAALLADAPFDCPCVAVQHSCVATWWASVKATPLAEDFRWRRDLVQRGLGRADVVVAPTSAFAAATERTYQLARQVLTVHNGRTARESRLLPLGNFVFMAGRLWDEGKNAGTLDRAAARIAAPFQAAGATLGPNGSRIALEHLVPLGELSQTYLGRVLAARPIFASASLYEPFGLAALEAAQAGCALVLSDIESHRELWGGAAIFVEARDDEGFAAVISDLLASPHERERLGREARVRAREFSPARMAQGMADIYAGVLQPQSELIAGAA
jgi:glycosyltransferase involved in cell wall biosynthesis